MAADITLGDGPPPPRRLALVRLLADGRFHSGEALAAELGVSRAAVWKQVREIGGRVGLRVDAVRGRGYRLAAPLELLDQQRLVRELAPETAAALVELLVLDTVASTNTVLLARRTVRSGLGAACVAEQQTAGRGRRGRSWVSPFGANAYLSLLWQFEQPAVALAGLSLAVGVAVAEVLRGLGAADAVLKWPNDVLCGGCKLGGVLVELAGEADGPTRAVVGVGVNHRMPPGDAALIEQAWTDLAAAVPGPLPSRHLLVARLLDALTATAQTFARDGLAPFLPRWDALDALRGRGVAVLLGERTVIGRALGITPSGALRLATAAGEREFVGGEVSLRPVDAGDLQ